MKIIFIFYCCFVLLHAALYAQDDKTPAMLLQPNPVLTKQLRLHFFTPKNNHALAYENNGQQVRITIADTFNIIGVASGTYKGYTGNWLIEAGDGNPAREIYIALKKNITDVTAEKHVDVETARSNVDPQNLVLTYSRLKLVAYLSIPLLLMAVYVWRVCPERVRPPWRKRYYSSDFL